MLSVGVHNSRNNIIKQFGFSWLFFIRKICYYKIEFREYFSFLALPSPPPIFSILISISL
ncbi:mCG147934 [Mus musculus]|nr:mCG147934 [Mus musculus]